MFVWTATLSAVDLVWHGAIKLLRGARAYWLGMPSELLYFCWRIKALPYQTTSAEGRHVASCWMSAYTLEYWNAVEQ